MFPKSSFTAVAGDILTPACKFVDGQAAVIGTAPAFCHAGFKLKGIYFFKREHGGCKAFTVALSGNQGGAEGSHNTGNIRTDGLAARNFFKASENGVVVEGSALDHNVFSEGGDVSHLDYFK